METENKMSSNTQQRGLTHSQNQPGGLITFCAAGEMAVNNVSAVRTSSRSDTNASAWGANSKINLTCRFVNSMKSGLTSQRRVHLYNRRYFPAENKQAVFAQR